MLSDIKSTIIEKEGNLSENPYSLLTDSKVQMLVKGLLQQADLRPTNLQQAVAIAALSLLKYKHKQLWHFYAGMGKSFIVATIALLSCVTQLHKQITIVIPNSYLLARDKSRFAPLFVNYQDKIAYTSELDFKVQKNQLVLIDEADDLLFKRPEDFFAVGGHKGCNNPTRKNNPSIICLTATMGNKTDLWHELLIFQNYSELSYWPKTVQVPAGIVRNVDEHDCNTIARD